MEAGSAVGGEDGDCRAVDPKEPKLQCTLEGEEQKGRHGYGRACEDAHLFARRRPDAYGTTLPWGKHWHRLPQLIFSDSL